MTPLRTFVSRVVLVSVGLLVLTGAVSCRRGRGGSGPGLTIGAEEQSAIFVSSTTYCLGRGLRDVRGEAKLLIDGSGSMNGFRDQLPTIAGWIDHGLSSLRNTAPGIAPATSSWFSQRVGISAPQPLSRIASGWAFSGSTNIHDAIEAAGSQAVTLILTDGIAMNAAAGGDCAQGVDPACVARRLAAAVSGAAGQKTAERGLWLIPLVSRFDGVHFSEKQMNVSQFDTSSVVEGIRLATGQEVVIQEPASGGLDGLHYLYRGPKVLLLIVVAEPAELGRATVQALYEAAARRGIARVEDLKGTGAGTSLLKPIEIYPGFLATPRWQEAVMQEPSEQETRGVMDISFEKESKPPTVKMQCPEVSVARGCGSAKKAEGAEALMQIATKIDAVTDRAGCVSMQVLVPFKFTLTPGLDTDSDAFSSLVPEAARVGDGYGTIKLHVKCGEGSSQAEAQYVAVAKYREGADCLADEGCAKGAAATVRSLSTDDGAQEPHKVFGLDSIFKGFYESMVGDEERRIPLGTLRFTATVSK